VSHEQEKLGLAKDLVEHAFMVYQYMGKHNDLMFLKDLMFKVAECNRSH
jgi:hypothetical protein